MFYGTVEAIWSNIEEWVLKSWKHELINYWMSNMVLRDASASKNNFFCIEVVDHIASLNRFLSLPRPLIPQVVTRDAFWMAEIEEIGGNFNPNTQPAGFYSTKCQESAHLRIQEKKQVLGQWSSMRNVWMLKIYEIFGTQKQRLDQILPWYWKTWACTACSMRVSSGKNW